MNRLKSTIILERPTPQKDAPKVVKSLSSIFSGNFLSKDNVISYLPYMLFITFLGVLYIANGYYAEKTVRNLYKTTTDLKELRSEYITIKSDLNYLSKQSQVAMATDTVGIKESIDPPSKIVVTKKEFQQIISKK